MLLTTWLGPISIAALKMNPTYYGMEDDTNSAVNDFLSKMIMGCLRDLERSSCIRISTVLTSNLSLEGDVLVEPTPLGKIASQYYLSHLTIRTFQSRLDSSFVTEALPDDRFPALLRLLCDAAEWAEIPVRHNEDLINRELEREVPYPVFGRTKGTVPATVAPYEPDSPHAKSMLLIEKHLDRGILPSTDYVTDTRTVLDSSIRVLQAMVDTAAYNGHLSTTLCVMEIVQCIKQAIWPTSSPLYQLPGLTTEHIQRLVTNKGSEIQCLGDLLALPDKDLLDWFKKAFGPLEAQKLCGMVRALPLVDISVKFNGQPVSSNKPSHLRLQPQKSYSLSISLSHHVVANSKRFPRPEMLQEKGQAFAPQFGKAQYEGWWVVLGDADREAVLGVKRITFQGQQQENSEVYKGDKSLVDQATKKKTDHGTAASSRKPSYPDNGRRSCNIHFMSLDEPGHYELTLFVISDAYLGLDQQVVIPITVELGGQHQ